MAESTSIEWCDATFNPWWGCQKVSPACDHCYAERDSKRFAPGRVLWGVGSERRTFDQKHWQQPLKWAKRPIFECEGCGARGDGEVSGGDVMLLRCPSCKGQMKLSRRRVFCASMGDWLDLNAPLAEFVRLLDTIRRTPELDWLLLSKRIGNWRKRLAEAARRDANDVPLQVWIDEWRTGTPPLNVWLGATVVNQEEADRDVPKLLAVPARVRFLSIEPMLGPVDVRFAFSDAGVIRCPVCMFGTNRLDHGPCPNDGATLRSDPGVHWVICGGESGPHARPAQIEWFRSLRQQCQEAGVAFNMKQLGAVVLDHGMSSPGEHWPEGVARIDRPRRRETDPGFEIRLQHRKGADMAEWPEVLRVREFPHA